MPFQGQAPLVRPAKVCSHPSGWVGTCHPANPGFRQEGLPQKFRGTDRSTGLMLLQRASSDPAANTSPHPVRRDTHTQGPLRGRGRPMAHKRRAHGWTEASLSQPEAPPPLGPTGQQAPPGGSPEATQALQGRSQPGRTCTVFSATRPAALWQTPHSPIP